MLELELIGQRSVLKGMSYDTGSLSSLATRLSRGPHPGKSGPTCLPPLGSGAFFFLRLIGQIEPAVQHLMGFVDAFSLE